MLEYGSIGLGPTISSSSSGGGFSSFFFLLAVGLGGHTSTLGVGDEPVKKVRKYQVMFSRIKVVSSKRQHHFRKE